MPVQLAAALRDDAGTDQIMERTELLGVVAAKIMWHEDITARIGTMVLHLVDNDGARCSVITGYRTCRPSA